MKVILTIILLVFSVGANPVDKVCKGFVEENDEFIPDTGLRTGGVTEAEFNSVLDKVHAEYKADFQAKGANFQIERLWSSGTVNAYAQQMGNTWMISMHGGLARHETVTADGFMLVACHEIGHHLGGAPKKWGMWASNEGQSDYFATLKCLRRMFLKENNEEAVANMNVDPFVKKECEEEFSDKTDQLVCIRGSMAGLSVSNLFKALRKEQRQPQFFEPDQNKVTSTNHNHPATQCRMDTYFNGARCGVAHTVAVSDTDYKTGTCDTQSFNTGSRPLCWFNSSNR